MTYSKTVSWENSSIVTFYCCVLKLYEVLNQYILLHWLWIQCKFEGSTLYCSLKKSFFVCLYCHLSIVHRFTTKIKKDIWIKWAWKLWSLSLKDCVGKLRSHSVSCALISIANTLQESVTVRGPVWNPPPLGDFYCI